MIFRLFVLVVSFLLSATLVVNAQQADPGTVAVKAALLHCIAPIAVGDDVARLAEQSKLPELPPEKAIRFVPKGGRAFALPEALGQVLLLARVDGSCSVAIRTLNVTTFWAAADKAFGSDTPWKSVSKENEADGTTKTYEAEFKGPAMAIVSARAKPVETGMQGLITVTRYVPDRPL